jgi:fimbrial chaperone protein
MLRLLGRSFAAALLGIAGLPVFAAATLEVAPVRHELAAARPLLMMTVTNRGAEPTTLQVRGFVWTQADGEDRLLPADDAVISPPMFTLAPGASQVVRGQLRPRAGDTREATYRLLIDELPSAQPEAAVRVALRLSIPVFVRPAQRAPADLGWQLDASGLRAVNEGSNHERVRELSLRGADGRTIAPLHAAPQYLLAGATRRWPLPERSIAAGEALVLRYVTDSGRVEVPLVARP